MDWTVKIGYIVPEELEFGMWDFVRDLFIAVAHMHMDLL